MNKVCKKHTLSDLSWGKGIEENGNESWRIEAGQESSERDTVSQLTLRWISFSKWPTMFSAPIFYRHQNFLAHFHNICWNLCKHLIHFVNTKCAFVKFLKFQTNSTTYTLWYNTSVSMHVVLLAVSLLSLLDFKHLHFYSLHPTLSLSKWELDATSAVWFLKSLPTRPWAHTWSTMYNVVTGLTIFVAMPFASFLWGWKK